MNYLRVSGQYHHVIPTDFTHISLVITLLNVNVLRQQQQKYLLTQIIYKAMIHEYTEYKISKLDQ